MVDFDNRRAKKVYHPRNEKMGKMEWFGKNISKWGKETRKT